MVWFTLFILLLFVPFLRLGLAFLVIFVIINILLIFGEVFFRLAFQKKRASSFSSRPRPKSPPASPLRKDDDIEDAEFREER